MSLNLMFTSATPRDDAAEWTAIKALGDDSGKVALDDATVVAIAALLEDAPLVNGEKVTTYDFSMTDEGTGRHIADAHVNAFGPSLLAADKLEALRALVRPHAGAEAMVDHIVSRGLQISLSTSDLAMRPQPHLKGVNWDADEVEVKASGGLMHQVLNRLGVPTGEEDSGECPFPVFAAAVESRGSDLGAMLPHMQSFVDCARRHDAVTVYWA
jgi:hypothetical protein